MKVPGRPFLKRTMQRIDAGWSSWQLVGLITRRSQVRVLPPQPRGSVAQSVEQRTENPRVGGSIPSRATTFFSSRPSHQVVRNRPFRRLHDLKRDVIARADAPPSNTIRGVKRQIPSASHAKNSLPAIRMNKADDAPLHLFTTFVFCACRLQYSRSITIPFHLASCQRRPSHEHTQRPVGSMGTLR